jgi:hypothetical protein
LTQEKLKELVTYDEDSGLLISKVDLRKYKKGDALGSTSKDDGCIRITLNRKGYLAHRLVFLYKTGEIPVEIDHKDKNPSNNRWSNLREVNRSQNSLNKTAYVNNKTGYKNVFFRKDISRYSVRISTNGVYRCFGVFLTAEEANEVATSKRKELHGEYARD